jgi:ribosome-associated protein
MAKKSKMADALAEVIIKGMQEKKAKNIVKIDLSHVNEAAADFFVVCHGESDRQVKAIADSVEEETIKAVKQKPSGREGQSENRWVLLDYVDVVVHVFQKDVRGFYEIEDLWHDGKFTNYDDVA